MFITNMLYRLFLKYIYIYNIIIKDEYCSSISCQSWDESVTIITELCKELLNSGHCLIECWHLKWTFQGEKLNKESNRRSMQKTLTFITQVVHLFIWTHIWEISLILLLFTTLFLHFTHLVTMSKNLVEASDSNTI